jgi:hypothetical protein
MLYADNIFHVKHMYTLFDMKSTIMPHRFQSIRYLRLSWWIAYSFQVSREYTDVAQPFQQNFWKRGWETIGQMRGLRSLEVEIFGIKLQPPFSDLLGPLCDIKHVPHFVVKLANSNHEEITKEYEGMEIPFQLYGATYTFEDPTQRAGYYRICF